MKITVRFMKGGVALPEFTLGEEATISDIWKKLEGRITLGSGSRLVYGRGESRIFIDRNDEHKLTEVKYILFI